MTQEALDAERARMDTERNKGFLRRRSDGTGAPPAPEFNDGLEWTEPAGVAMPTPPRKPKLLDQVVMALTKAARGPWFSGAHARMRGHRHYRRVGAPRAASRSLSCAASPS